MANFDVNQHLILAAAETAILRALREFGRPTSMVNVLQVLQLIDKINTENLQRFRNEL